MTNIEFSKRQKILNSMKHYKDKYVIIKKKEALGYFDTNVG